MKVLFAFPGTYAFDSWTVRNRPTGGTNKAVIYLGEALRKLGDEVAWATTLEELQDRVSWQPDVVIAQAAEVFTLFSKAYCVWWVHHYPDQEIVHLQLAAARQYARHLVVLSQAQADAFSRELSLSRQSPPTVIGYGMWTDELHPHAAASKDPYRLIYCSTPYRGLDYLPAIFPMMKKLVPQATLTVCSSMTTYGLSPGLDQEFQETFEALAAIPGVRLTGALNQVDLYRELAQARFFFYPCTFAETYCLAMDEALAHDCWPLVSEIECSGCLGERVTLCEPDKLLDAYLAGVKGKPSLESTHTPKSWLEVARQWKQQVLSRAEQEDASLASGDLFAD